MNTQISILLACIAITSACSRTDGGEHRGVLPGEYRYFPDAEIRTIGSDTAYETPENFRFTIPKEWVLLGSQKLWVIGEDGERVELNDTINSFAPQSPDMTENVFFARQFNILDPAVVIGLELIPRTGESRATQKQLREDSAEPEFEAEIEEMSRTAAEAQFNHDQAVVSFTWIDGGVKNFGEWVCFFHLVNTAMRDQDGKIVLSVTCPSGKRSLRVTALFVEENKAPVLEQVAKFVSSFDSSHTDWHESDD